MSTFESFRGEPDSSGILRAREHNDAQLNDLLGRSGKFPAHYNSIVSEAQIVGELAMFRLHTSVYDSPEYGTVVDEDDPLCYELENDIIKRLSAEYEKQETFADGQDMFYKGYWSGNAAKGKEISVLVSSFTVPLRQADGTVQMNRREFALATIVGEGHALDLPSELIIRNFANRHPDLPKSTIAKMNLMQLYGYDNFGSDRRPSEFERYAQAA